MMRFRNGGQRRLLRKRIFNLRPASWGRMMGWRAVAEETSRTGDLPGIIMIILAKVGGRNCDGKR